MKPNCFHWLKNLCIYKLETVGGLMNLLSWIVICHVMMAAAMHNKENFTKIHIQSCLSVLLTGIIHLINGLLSLSGL